MSFIKKIIYRLFLLVFSKQFYKMILRKKLILFKEKNNIALNAPVIFYPYSIGDVFNLSIFINEFKKENNYDLVYLSTKKYITGIEGLIQKLGVNHIIAFDEKLYIYLRLGGFIHDYSNNIFVLNHIYNHEKVRKTITFFDYFPLLLAINTPRNNINIILKAHFIKLNKEFSNGKIKKAILFPYPGTLDLIDERYWDEIVKILKEKGIEIYTNVINDKQRVIKGSRALRLKLNEVVSFVDKDTIIIARRNGLNDVFAFNNCKQLIIYVDSRKNEFKRYNMLDLYERLDRKGYISEICIDKLYNKQSRDRISTSLLEMLDNLEGI